MTGNRLRVIVDKMSGKEMELDEMFTSATKYLRHMSGQVASDKLLYFYARFKQATEGQCKTSKPGFFDFQGKAKWDAWHRLGDMSREQAMMEYVSLLSNIDEHWMDRLEGSHGEESERLSRRPAHRGLGVSVSVMAQSDTELRDVDKTVFDWCQEGSVDRVRQLLLSGTAHVDSLDQEGLGLLHWSCDRGDVDMTKMLLSLGADINRQASDLQTALHYAVSCDHKDVTELLVRHGVDVTLKDDCGNTAMDVANDGMKLFLLGLKLGVQGQMQLGAQVLSLDVNCLC